MPLPRWLRGMNRRVTNPAMRRVSGRAKYFGTLIHKGRKSGTIYRTPVNAFPSDGGYIFALTYGSDVDWLRNVEAAGECRLRYRGRILWLVDPVRISEGEAMPAVPATVRGALKALSVHEFMAMRTKES